MGKEEHTYKILDSYRNKSLDKGEHIIGLIGLAALVISPFIDSVPLSIAGAALFGLAIVDYHLGYRRGYMEAELDHLENSKFTRLEE